MASEDGPNEASGLARHFKRYGAFYAIALVIAIVAVVLPTRGGDDDDSDTGTEEVAAGDDDDGDAGWAPASGELEPGTGKTVGGVDCKDGVKQVPDLQYSLPCVPEFEGDNGGATSRGVTADTIKVVIREFPTTPNSQEAEKQIRDAGFATGDDSRAIREQFWDFYNKNFELYGRKVEFVRYESKFSNATTEALGGGREGACQDATLIADELQAFAVTGGGGVFAECAAEKGLVVFGAAAYFSESWYDKWSPYVYNTTMSCDRISALNAEYIGKRLAGKPAKWAGDPELAKSPRKFGTYVPDNEEYQKCTDVTERLLKDEYKAEPGLRVSYALDISRFADQAKRAIIQFKADKVTTIVTASEPFSIGMLTKEATAQGYFPEWFIIGTAAQDTDNFGRSYDQKQVDGHMFGISQLSSNSKLFGDGADAPKLYAKLNPGKKILGGTTASLYDDTHIFNLLQAAGPDLKPENIEKGIAKLPSLGAPDFAAGKWTFSKSIEGDTDHTAVDDVREVYWDGQRRPRARGAGQDQEGLVHRGELGQALRPRRLARRRIPRSIPDVPEASRKAAAGVAAAFIVVALWALLDNVLERGLPLGIVGLGAVSGLLYAINAIGLVLIFRANRVINFAQAEFGSVAAVLAIQLSIQWHFPFFVSVPIALVVGGDPRCVRRGDWCCAASPGHRGSSSPSPPSPSPRSSPGCR